MRSIKNIAGVDFKKIAIDNSKIINEDGGYQLPNSKWVGLDSIVGEGNVFYPNPVCEGKISVVQETTLSGLRRYPYSVALNFASGNHPGGAYHAGEKAQEESLCRASNLYEALAKVEEFYNQNNSYGSPLFTDAIIYTSDVTFFRDEDQNLLDKTFKRAIITAPAPKFHRCTEEERSKVLGIFYRRINKILQIANEKMHGDIILGAWGCGAYSNNPHVVAKIFKICLADYRYNFDNIVFSITDPDMCKIFKEELIG